MTPRKPNLRYASVTLAAGALSLAGTMASADIQHLDDVIISFSLCVGNDCVNGESFGFDTVRLKENNTRLHFDDTSSSASFPKNDWRFIANDSSNGGGSYMAIEDSTAGRQVFRVDAGAPANALRVDSAGDVGIGQGNPVLELHITDGDSPTIRLEQDGSSGFTPQTFDVAANEANFFIRDVTNGSQLPFKIKPGADSNSLFIAADNDIGMGTDNPAANLHVRRTASLDQPNLLVESLGTGDAAEIWLETAASTSELKLELLADNFNISFNGTGNSELQIQRDGDVRVVQGNLEVLAGSVIVQGSTVHPDYVFAPDYRLMPLHEVEAFITKNRHLPKIPSATDVQANGLNLTDMQMALLEKVEELTLYTLQQQKTIDALQARLETLAD